MQRTAGQKGAGADEIRSGNVPGAQGGVPGLALGGHAGRRGFWLPNQLESVINWNGRAGYVAAPNSSCLELRLDTLTPGSFQPRCQATRLCPQSRAVAGSNMWAAA